MEYCRVCIKESESHESFTSDYREQFFQVTSIYIDESEREFICNGCVKRLIHAFEFRQEAIKADLWFREKSLEYEAEIKPSKIRKKSLIKPKKSKVEIKEEDQITRKIKLYSCDICHLHFNTKTSIGNHMRDQHIQREFTCSEPNCGKQFSTKRIYRKHLSTHLPEQKWICEYCAKSFGTKYKLTLHSRSHTNIRPYKCQQCNASFKQATDLNTHLKSIHSTDRPFLCKDCGLSFKIPNSLRSHRKRKHQQERMLTCNECQKRLMCKSELQEHMAIYHRGERNHICKYCPKTYTKSYHLRRHYHDSHGELYRKMIESGELRTIIRGTKPVEKVEIVPTPQQTPITCSIENEATTLIINYCS